MDFKLKAGPELWAIDLDRTLLDTNRAFDHLVSVANGNTPVTQREFYRAKLETEASGGSFDVLGYLGKQGVLPELVDEVRERFGQNEEQHRLLYDDALPLFSRLDATRNPSLILTYGAFEWQYAKLQASGLSEREHLITNHKSKGEVIDGWRRASGNYGVETISGAYLVSSTVVLVDDKAQSFEGLPEDCKGYYVERPRELQLASQQGVLPPHVKVVSSLRDLVPLIKG